MVAAVRSADRARDVLGKAGASFSSSARTCRCMQGADSPMQQEADTVGLLVRPMHPSLMLPLPTHPTAQAPPPAPLPWAPAPARWMLPAAASCSLSLVWISPTLTPSLPSCSRV